MQSFFGLLGFLIALVATLVFALLCGPAITATFAFLSKITLPLLVLFAVTALAAAAARTTALSYLVGAAYCIAAAALAGYMIIGSLRLALPAMVCLLPFAVLTIVPTFACYLVAALGAGPVELSARHFLIGTNAAVNLLFAGAVYPLAFFQLMGVAGALVGVIMAVHVALASYFAADRPTDGAAKTVIGWSGWLMPTAWFTVALGCALLFVSFLVHLLVGWLFPFCAIQSVGIRPDTGSFVVRGGLAGNLNLVQTAYDLGPIVFVHFQMPCSSFPAVVEYVETHEVGHHLSLGAFGTHFHFIGWFDEILQGALSLLFSSGGGGAAAYAERIAQSNVPAALEAQALGDLGTCTGGVFTPAPRVDVWT